MTAQQQWNPERYTQQARSTPWYFPTLAAYRQRLETQGFTVGYLALIPRPTPLPGDITGWLETFAESFTATLAMEDRPAFIEEVRETLRPALCNTEGHWTADYVMRYRYPQTSTLKPAESPEPAVPVHPCPAESAYRCGE